MDEREGGTHEEQQDHDAKAVREIIKVVQPDLNLDKLNKNNCVRLGRHREGDRKRPRPIKVVFDEPSSRTAILRKAWRLKDSTQYRKVGISADKTQRERQEEQALRKELLERRRKGEDVCIFKGRVVTMTEKEKMMSSAKRDEGIEEVSVKEDIGVRGGKGGREEEGGGN